MLTTIGTNGSVTLDVSRAGSDLIYRYGCNGPDTLDSGAGGDRIDANLDGFSIITDGRVLFAPGASS